MPLEPRLRAFVNATQGNPNAGAELAQPFYTPNRRRAGALPPSVREEIESVSVAFGGVFRRFVQVETGVNLIRTLQDVTIRTAGDARWLMAIRDFSSEISGAVQEITFVGTGITSIAETSPGKITVDVSSTGGTFPPPLKGTGSPLGAVTGVLGQDYRDTLNEGWFKCISDPSGTAWVATSVGI